MELSLLNSTVRLKIPPDILSGESLGEVIRPYRDVAFSLRRYGAFDILNHLYLLHHRETTFLSGIVSVVPRLHMLVQLDTAHRSIMFYKGGHLEKEIALNRSYHHSQLSVY